MIDQHLSANFTLAELTRTTVRDFMLVNQREAERDAAVLTALRTLCYDLLEPVRARFGAPIFVHSGFRMPALNRAVGGQPGSQHALGEAVDFHVHGQNLREVFDWIRLKSGLKFGQVILEGRPPAWIHLSLGEPFRDPARCGQALIATPTATGEMKYERV